MDYLERLESLIEEGVDLLQEQGHADIVSAIRFRMERDNCVSLSHIEWDDMAEELSHLI